MKCQRITCSEFGRRLIRTRTVTQDTTLDTKLKRCLNAPQLTLYCVAHMVGAGLYVLTGQLIRDYAGPATSLAYLVSVVTSIFTALCYAEFTTLFPRAGSAYLYTYLMFGELPAFLIGWTMISDVIVSTATISKALSGTFNLLTNNTIRNWSEEHLFKMSYPGLFDTTPDVVAAAFILILILLTITGAQISLTINAVLSGLQIVCLIVITIACFLLGSPSNLTNYGGFLPYGVDGLLRGAGLAVFAFSGFEAVANASEEARNPRRDLPIALFGGLIICAVLYITASLGLAYLVPPQSLSYESPYVSAFAQVGNLGMMGFAAFSTILATGATKLVTMYVIPRMFYSIAHDGLLFGFMAFVEKRTGVPLWSLLIGGVVTILLATFINVKALAQFTSVGIIFCYFVIGLDLMVLRYLVSELHYLTDDRSEILVENAEHEYYLEEKPSLKVDPKPPTLRLRKYTPVCLRDLESTAIFNILLLIYTTAVIFVGITLNVAIKNHINWVWILCGISGSICFFTFVLLCFYQPHRNLKGFETPIMPVAPCITILANGILITSMESLTWLRFVIWSAVGLVIYFSYGIWFSKADEGPESRELNQSNVGDRYKVPDPQSDQT
ncbi:hypothetical protein CRM22_009019 [Opisthorchis felineus]|uniref:Cationic amino acid transporter C-terminal domain-containing protein n=1 Tax=Opisthorchis felineus TaxID=147828 RepID=A0A4S2L991_OPIFE|nr:hypothetical protein CRM22_009019 [Opisthorchis felineus]